MTKAFSIVATLLFFVASISAQTTGTDPVIVGLSIEVGKISKSVASLSESVKEFVEKADTKSPASGVASTDKQAKLAAGLQLLANAEQLLIVRQRFQIELVEKQGSTRTRLAQVERDVMPQNIDRSVQYEGTTRTEELRDNRRAALLAERASLQGVLAQITSTLADTNESVKEAQSLVLRLRRQYIPELEKELER
jgi:hypothetical protein